MIIKTNDLIQLFFVVCNFLHIIDMEEWRKVNHLSRYEISSLGNIRDFNLKKMGIVEDSSGLRVKLSDDYGGSPLKFTGIKEIRTESILHTIINILRSCDIEYIIL